MALPQFGRQAPGPQEEGPALPPSRKPELRVAKNLYHRHLLRRFASIAAATLLALLVIYLCFAATLLRVLPSTTTAPLPVKNSTVLGGIAPPGTLLVVNRRSKQGDSMVDYLKQSLLPQSDVAVGRVAAGPYGRVVWAPGVPLQVDGKPVKVTLPQDPRRALSNGQYLKDMYVMECVEGACVPGEAFLLPADNIYGQPLTKKG